MRDPLNHKATLAGIHREKSGKLREYAAALTAALPLLHPDDRAGITKCMSAPADGNPAQGDPLRAWTEHFREMISEYEVEWYRLLDSEHSLNPSDVQSMVDRLERLKELLLRLYEPLNKYDQEVLYQNCENPAAGPKPAAGPEAFAAVKTNQKKAMAGINELLPPLKKLSTRIADDAALKEPRKPKEKPKRTSRPERLFFIGSALAHSSDLYVSTLRNAMIDEVLQQLHVTLNYPNYGKGDVPPIYRLGSQTLGESHQNHYLPIKHARDIDLISIGKAHVEALNAACRKTAETFTADAQGFTSRTLTCGLGGADIFPKEFQNHAQKKLVDQQHITLLCYFTPDQLKHIPPRRGSEMDRTVLSVLVGQDGKFRPEVIERINRSYEACCKDLSAEEKEALHATPERIPVALSVECLHNAPRPILNPSIPPSWHEYKGLKPDPVGSVKAEHFVARAHPYMEVVNLFRRLATHIPELEKTDKVSSKLGCSLIDLFIRYEVEKAKIGADPDTELLFDDFLRAMIVLHMPFERDFYKANSFEEIIPKRELKIPTDLLAKAVTRDCDELYYMVPKHHEAMDMISKALAFKQLPRGAAPHDAITINYDKLMAIAVNFFTQKYSEICMNLRPEERRYLELAYACRNNPEGMKGHEDVIRAVVPENVVYNLRRQIWISKNTAPQTASDPDPLKTQLAQLVSDYVAYTVKSYQAVSIPTEQLSPPPPLP